MSSTTPAMDAALAAPSLLMFCAVEIALPDRVLRLLDAPGRVSFAGRTFLGIDPVFGVLGGVESITDGVEDEAPDITLTLEPPTLTAAATLASPAMQGSPVTIWLGVMDRATGAVIADPLVIFLGEIDVPSLTGDRDRRALQFSITSVFELLFETDEGVRLNNSFHQSVWPGELGLEYVTEVQRQLPWGAEGARPVAVRDVLS